MTPRSQRRVLRAFDLALICYPAAFRARFGPAMRLALQDRLEHERRSVGFAVAVVAKTAAQGLAERRYERRRRRDRNRASGRKQEPMRVLVQDLKFAFRMIGRRPVIAMLSVLTLALGIGAASAVFSLVDAALLRPLALPEPGRLVSVLETAKAAPEMVAYDNFVDWQTQTQAFAALAALRPQTVNLTGLEQPDRVRGGFVTPGFFGVAGVKPALGRALVPEDDQPSAAPVAVINDTVWRTRFGRAPDILGRAIHLNNVAFTIVGVMPEGFWFPYDAVEVWLPLHFVPSTLSRDAHSLVAFGRLRPGVSPAEGKADLQAIAARLAVAYPKTNDGRGVSVVPLQQWLTAGSRSGLQTVFALVLVLLGAACANVAGLQVGAAAERRAEMAIRAALGAGRRRLARQLLTEHLLVALVAGTLGVALAAELVPMVVGHLPAGTYGFDQVRLDARVVLFSIALTLLAGLLSGLLPTMFWAGRAPAESLRGVGRAIGERWFSRTRAWLVAGQVAMAAVLLTSAGLLVRSYANLIHVDTGFRGEHLLTMEYRLPANKYPSAAAQAVFHDEVVTRVSAVPGVRRAAVVRALPLSGNGDSLTYRTLGEAASVAPKHAAVNTVSDEYFRALGIPLLKGRTFDERDRSDAPVVVVVSRALAAQAWPGADPIGRSIVIPGYPVAPTVIGVVGDVRQFELSDEELPQLYARNAQNPGIFMTLVAQTDGDPLALAGAVTNAVWQVDPDQPVWKVRTLASLVDAASASSRFLLQALTIFSAAAVLLVVAGLYGVASQGVSRRSREIGMRMVLGASRGTVLREALRSALRPAVAGLLVGLAASVVVARLIVSVLYGASPTDIAPYLATAAVLLTVAVLACYVPARRAAALDPAVVLRDS